MTEKEQTPIAVGDVVQLVPTKSRWGAAFVVVTEVRAWGVVGYFEVADGSGGGQAPIRVNHGDYVRIGPAVFFAGSMFTEYDLARLATRLHSEEETSR